MAAGKGGRLDGTSGRHPLPGVTPLGTRQRIVLFFFKISLPGAP